ncbi:glycosyltransferase [Sphingomonas sp. MMS24-J45]|uniref:glycosyltransferase n=1 Tax=Sphingomonas sp. MMS24-J45 TaxID=3238806 RepID=UPI00384DD539
MLSWIGMPILLRRIAQLADSDGGAATIVVTTPHYLPLARRAAGRSAIVYYCSDDYRSYAGWDARRMARDEAALCRIARLSIFVSEALRARAVSEYALDPAKTCVSPNATEPRFAVPSAKPPGIAALPSPIFGAAGVLNTRIDLDFLAAVAADSRVGSLALVGPVEAALEDNPTLERLRADPKVHFFGAQPHEDMPRWMASFDVAVIPYAATPFNHFCSPMRLYDHLAIGQPIIATPHCDQIATRPEVLTGEIPAVPQLVGSALETLKMGRVQRIETWDHRVVALQESPVAGFGFPQ